MSAVRYEWFQTPSALTFTFYVRDRSEENVKVTLDDRKLDVTIALDGGREYQYESNTLFALVQKDSLKTVVKSTKVEVTVSKAEQYQWPTLEVKDPVIASAAQSSAATAAAVAPKTGAELQYPNSKGRDWSKVQLDVEEASGDPTNDFFKKIFSGGSDEQRRAMMKSFTESNGTVLSTNWEDVGSRHVKGEPPKGMEEKKWSE